MTRVELIYGQYGAVFSPGFRNFGKRLEGLGYSVGYWNPVYPDSVVADVLGQPKGTKIALVGYSLGGNSVSWVADRLGTHTVDLAVAYDPTVNSYVTPLRKNVRRALSYHQTGYWFFSLAFGRSVLTRAADGPRIEEYKFVQDHLMVQSNEQLHQMTIAALHRL